MKKLPILFIVSLILLVGSVFAYSGIPYWINNSNTIWLKNNFSLGKNILYIFFNPNETISYSNGQDVFDVFDDFDGSNLNTSKWDIDSIFTSYDVSGGKLIVTDLSTSASWSTLYPIKTQISIPNTYGFIAEIDDVTFNSSSSELMRTYLAFSLNGNDWDDYGSGADSILQIGITDAWAGATGSKVSVINTSTYSSGSDSLPASADISTLKIIKKTDNNVNTYWESSSILSGSIYTNPSYVGLVSTRNGADAYGGFSVSRIIVRRFIDNAYNVSFGNVESGSWVINGVTYNKRRKIIIDTNQILENYPVSFSYTLFNDTNLYVPFFNVQERTEQVIDVEQPSTVYIWQTSWQNIIAGNFNLDNSSNVSFSVTIEALNNYADSQLNCRFLVDGQAHGSQVNQTSVVGTYGVYYLSTPVFELANGTHSANLQCRRAGSFSYWTIRNSHGIMRIYKDKITQENIPFVNNNVTKQVTSTSYTKIAELNFTTTNANVSDTIQKFLILDGHLQYNYDSTGTITTKLIIKDSQNTSFEFPRYGEAGDSGSLGGLRISTPINSTDSENITIEIYAKSTTGDGNVQGNFIVTEEVMHLSEVNQTTLNNTNISASTSYVNIANFSISDESHASANMVVKATIPFKASASNTRVRFRLRIENDTGAIITKDVSFANEYSVAVIQDVFQIGSGTYNIYLDSISDGGYQISGGVFSAYISDIESFEPLYFNVSAYNVWDNQSLNSFNVTLGSSGAMFEAINGTAKVIPNNDLENLTISAQDYFNKTYYNWNTSNNLNASLHQNEITIFIKHIVSGNEIPYNMTLNVDNGYFIRNNFSSGQTFYFNSTNHTLKFNLTHYLNLTENIDLSDSLINTTYTFYLQPIVAFNFMDEKTIEPFNLSDPKRIIAQVYCVNNSEILEEEIDENNAELNLTCDYRKIKFIVDYNSETYYRTYPKITDSFDYDNFNMTIWLLNLNTTNVILNTFQIYDLFGDYDNPMILFYRTIGNETYLITGDIVDIENKISAFLIQNQEYNVKVLSDNQPEKNIGTYFADVAGSSIIRLFNIDLATITTEFSSLVRQYIYLVNDSNNLKIRAAVYTDDVSIIQNSEFIVRYNSEAGAIICQQSSIEQNVEFSCDVPDDLNNIYWAQLDIIDSSGEHHYYTRILKGTDKINFEFNFSNEENRLWFWIFAIIILFLLLAFLPFPVGVKVLIFLFILLFLNMMDWISLSNLSSLTAAQNKNIGNAILSVLMLITIIKVIRK